MEKLKTIWSMQPGDGTGCSIADATVRNQNGVCSILGCGKALTSDAVSYGILQKLCSDHEAEHKKWLNECLSWDKEILRDLNLNK